MCLSQMSAHTIFFTALLAFKLSYIYQFKIFFSAISSFGLLIQLELRYSARPNMDPSDERYAVHLNSHSFECGAYSTCVFDKGKTVV